MQSPTHILMGIFLYKLLILVFPNLPVVWQIVFSAILVFLSHALLDAMAVMTYHPYEAKWDDLFFKMYHIVLVFGLTIAFLIIFFIPYWWVMIFATLPDIIDWYTLRPIWHHDPVIHPYIDTFRDRCFNWLPNFKEKRWAAGIEMLLLVGLGLGVYFL